MRETTQNQPEPAAAAPADAADAAKMLAADEQAAAAHGLPRIDATNAAQYRPPDLTEDPDNRAARLEPTSVPGSGQRRTIIVTEPPDMLADVHAKFGGRPPRSRRAA